MARMRENGVMEKSGMIFFDAVIIITVPNPSAKESQFGYGESGARLACCAAE